MTTKKGHVRITEYPYRNVAIMFCEHCKNYTGVRTEDAQFAYLEINKFRGAHEHLEGE